MTRFDAWKLALLLLAIVIWFFGMRANSHPVMIVAIVLVVVAFLLRFIKHPPPAARAE